MLDRDLGPIQDCCHIRALFSPLAELSNPVPWNGVITVVDLIDRGYNTAARRPSLVTVLSGEVAIHSPCSALDFAVSRGEFAQVPDTPFRIYARNRARAVICHANHDHRPAELATWKVQEAPVVHLPGGIELRSLTSLTYFRKDFSYSRVILEPGQQIGRHRHKRSCELIIVGEGKGSFHKGSRLVPMNEGSVLFVDYDTWHWVEADTRLEFDSLKFPPLDDDYEFTS